MCEDCKQTTDSGAKKESYYKELYNVCKYVNEHPEEFEEFNIYQSLTHTNSNDSNEKRNLSLHNRLISQYRILIGEKKTDTSDNSVEGFDIEPSIDTSCLDVKTLSHILVVFHHFVNKGKSRINQKKMLRSVNVDKSSAMMDYLVNKINSDNVQCNSYRLFDDARNQLKRELQQEFLEKYQSKKRNMLEDYNWKIAFFAEKLTNNLCLFYDKAGKLSSTFQAWLYMDLCCWAILQFVITGIMRNKQVKNKLESIEMLNTQIVRLIKQEKEEKNLIKLEGSPEEVMFKFFSFYYEKDRHLQDVAILDYITKSGEKRKNPSDEYSLIRFSPQGKTIQWQEILDLFSEGKPEKSLRSFKDSLLACHKGIFRFNEISRRNLKPEPVTLRVFYRELYMDDTKYNSRQSKSIFNDFLKNEDMDMKTGDYYFINEKINAGNFREYGLVDEFYAKNNLQRNLYCLICYFLAVLNPAEMITKFQSALKNISAVIAEIYNENSGVAESRRCEGLEEEKKLQLEIREVINYQKEHVEELKYSDTKNIMELCFKLYNIKFPDGEL